MSIFPLSIFPLSIFSRKQPVPANIQRIRRVREINLAAREAVEDVNWIYPIDTPAKRRILNNIEAWRQNQIKIINNTFSNSMF